MHLIVEAQITVECINLIVTIAITIMATQATTTIINTTTRKMMHILIVANDRLEPALPIITTACGMSRMGIQVPTKTTVGVSPMGKKIGVVKTMGGLIQTIQMMTKVMAMVATLTEAPPMPPTWPMPQQRNQLIIKMMKVMI